MDLWRGWGGGPTLSFWGMVVAWVGGGVRLAGYEYAFPYVVLFLTEFYIYNVNFPSNGGGGGV